MMCINDFLLLMWNRLFAGDAANAKIIACGKTGDCLWTLTADEVLTVSGNGAMEDYRKDSTPWRTYAIQTAVIMQGVTNIGDYAFSGCRRLTSIIIPDSVTSIGDGAFDECSGLTSIIVPDSVTSIGTETFYDCSGLTSIIIPDSVTSIGIEAFAGCSGLTSIIIPDLVTSIDFLAFGDCSGLTSIIIPDSVTSIDNWAFSGCRNLTAINVEESNTAYSSVDGILFNKDRTTLTICPGGKNGNYSISDSVTSIGDWAFSGCSGLTSIIIPNSVTSINCGNFSGCSGLTSIIIPDSVTSIGNWAFSDCSGLTSIINLNATPQNIDNHVFDGTDTDTCVLQVPANAVSAYKNANEWRNFKNIIAIEDC